MTGFSDLAALLDKNTKGAMFVMGDYVTYADLIVATVLETIRLVTPDEWEQKLKQWDNGRWGKLQTLRRVVRNPLPVLPSMRL